MDAHINIVIRDQRISIAARFKHLPDSRGTQITA